ncbi:MAG: DNA translocase FtsK [Verrucomicrobiota bacterium]
MPRKRSSNTKKGSDIKAPSMRSRWLWAGASALIAILLLIAFFDYDYSQHPSSGTTDPSPNAIGKLGALSAASLFDVLGRSAWLFPPFLLWNSLILIRKSRRPKWLLWTAIATALISFSVVMDLFHEHFANPESYHRGPGGLIGNLLYQNFLEIYLGNVGSGLIFFALWFVSIFIIILPSSADPFGGAGSWFGGLKERWAVGREERAENKRLKKLALQEERDAKKAEREAAVAEKLAAKQAAEEEKAAAKRLAAEGKAATKGKTLFEPEIDPEPTQEPAKPKKPKLSDKLKIVEAKETKKARVKLPTMEGDYTFPTLDILPPPAEPHASNSEEEHAQNAERLLQTLKEFRIEVTLGEVHIGPVITRYEVYPAPGVRVEKISSLDKNIALGMHAQSVRILAPVPGKGCVGIEVPNQHPTPVGIREILESEDWAKSKAEIPIALGRDVSGKPIISDLTRMPHLLIAGSTGSGKTVCINSIITSLLYHSSPENLRFIMVDPKIVEMKVFNSLPHMLIPVVTDPKKVPGALKWLLNEMEHRYQMFAKKGVRNIAGFNARKKREKEKTEAEKFEEEVMADQPELEIKVPRDEGVLDEIPDKLPYIVCIVDELADLMMVNPAEIETGIARLAQLARAAGIHLVLATQRPSVNVITGVIKANLPCRIAFQVASKIDSRTILDGPGAEQLIGRGDMLFSPPGSSALIRSQGSFVDDHEIADIVEFLKQNGPPKFAEAVQRQIDSGDDEDGSMGGGGLGDEGDEMFKKAIAVLQATKRASTSMLQRRLKIGYNRAANLMDELEERGIVGPENGSSPREILVDLDSM